MKAITRAKSGKKHGILKYSIDLPEELIARIDADAAENGRKRSDHIRFLLAKMVHQLPPLAPTEA
jgi:metal-responsive CopG/Arc/MetJ family transcriptional regulator